jgi:hypothetical protein
MLTGSTRRISLAILAAVVAATTVAASTQAQAHSSSCTPAHLMSAFKQVEAECGSAKIISAHRPGARIRGTGRVSQHASCDGTHGAIDVVFSNRACALTALRKTNYTILTYGKSSHIHIGTDGWRNGNARVARRNTTRARVADARRSGVRSTSRQRASTRVAQNQWPHRQDDWSSGSWSDAGWSGDGSANSAYAQRRGGARSASRRARVASRQRANDHSGWNDASWSSNW